MVAIAKEECGINGKAAMQTNAVPATASSERGRSEKSIAFLSASNRTTPVGAPA